jgi:hypothetical protein
MILHPWPIMITAIAVIIVLSVIAYYRRRSTVQRFALEHGFEYQEKSNADLLEVKETSFYNQYCSYYNIVSGSFWAGTLLRGDSGPLSADEQSGPAKPIGFTYFEQVTPGRHNQKTESFVRFEVPETSSLHPADTVRFEGLDVLGYSIEKFGNKIFVWQPGQRCLADALGGFLRSAYSACRCQWEW